MNILLIFSLVSFIIALAIVAFGLYRIFSETSFSSYILTFVLGLASFFFLSLGFVLLYLSLGKKEIPFGLRIRANFIPRCIN